MNKLLKSPGMKKAYGSLLTIGIKEREIPIIPNTSAAVPKPLFFLTISTLISFCSWFIF